MTTERVAIRQSKKEATTNPWNIICCLRMMNFWNDKYIFLSNFFFFSIFLLRMSKKLHLLPNFFVVVIVVYLHLWSLFVVLFKFHHFALFPFIIPIQANQQSENLFLFCAKLTRLMKFNQSKTTKTKNVCAHGSLNDIWFYRLIHHFIFTFIYFRPSQRQLLYYIGQ